LTTFKYKGITADGQKVSGVLDSYSESEAVAQIRDKCAIITEISEVQTVKAFRGFGIGKVKDKDLSILCALSSPSSSPPDCR
jgi:type IV pilus assembly protein PilC